MSGSRKTLRSPQDLYDAVSHKTVGYFNRDALGLNYDTYKRGPKSAALAGELRSKFEAPDETDKAKTDDYKQKLEDAQNKYNQDYDKWYSELKSMPKNTTEYFNMFEKKPKFKKPRKPSKSKKKTTDLPPEQRIARGRETEATIEHEGFHHAIDDLAHKYGRDTAKAIEHQMISQYDPNTFAAVGDYISTRLRYKPGSKAFNEEIMAHSRDILVSPKKREDFKKFLSQKREMGEDQIKSHIKNLKTGQQNAYKLSQRLDPKDFGIDESPGVNTEEPIAASRTKKSEGGFKLPRFKKT